jgi:hypothetical protein
MVISDLKGGGGTERTKKWYIYIIYIYIIMCKRRKAKKKLKKVMSDSPTSLISTGELIITKVLNNKGYTTTLADGRCIKINTVYTHFDPVSLNTVYTHYGHPVSLNSYIDEVVITSNFPYPLF